MSSPIVVDLPHELGAEEARRRIDRNIGGLAGFIPGGADVRTEWAGNRLNLALSAMGQEVSARIDIFETVVRVEILLPPALGFLGRAIEAALRKRGGVLLEDRTKER